MRFSSFAFSFVHLTAILTGTRLSPANYHKSKAWRVSGSRSGWRRLRRRQCGVAPIGSLSRPAPPPALPTRPLDPMSLACMRLRLRKLRATGQRRISSLLSLQARLHHYVNISMPVPYPPSNAFPYARSLPTPLIYWSSSCPREEWILILEHSILMLFRYCRMRQSLPARP